MTTTKSIDITPADHRLAIKVYNTTSQKTNCEQLYLVSSALHHDACSMRSELRCSNDSHHMYTMSWAEALADGFAYFHYGID
jgi:hypothetical protein